MRFALFIGDAASRRRGDDDDDGDGGLGVPRVDLAGRGAVAVVDEFIVR